MEALSPFSRAGPSLFLQKKSDFLSLKTHDTLVFALAICDHTSYLLLSFRGVLGAKSRHCQKSEAASQFLPPKSSEVSHTYFYS